MKYIIVIVGLGALGKRHLSSILNSGLALDVYCYDINANALDGFEWEDKYGNKKLVNISSLADIPDEIDFVLFSTTSRDRRELFEQLVSNKKVKYILFEKVLFQKVEDYEYVSSKLHELGIRAWVNCPRRQMDCYQRLKEMLKDAKDMKITLYGGEWGLACNAIHMLDIFEFLSGSNATTVDKIDLLPCIVESKRQGYKEVYGTIYGHSGRCKEFSITCLKDSDVQDMMTINTDIGQYIILENNKKIIKQTKEDNYEIKEEVFDTLYQSQMTQYVLEDILLRNESRLTIFEDSARLHLEFIKPLIEFFEKHGMEKKLCPIT